MEYDLSKVLEQSLCVACGACVCADQDLRLELNPVKMMFEPSGPGNRDAARVCPAIGVDFDGLQEKVFGAAGTGELGVVESICLAQSTNYRRNLEASSGGVIKELLIEYLCRDEVDGAIVLCHTKGLGFEPRLINQVEEVDRLPGSIYHNVRFEKALQLLSGNKGRFVLVALPCQLEGIYSYVFKHRPELNERIYATIGLVCGWSYTRHSIKALCRFKGLRYEDIEDIAYRGGGPVGLLQLRSPERAVAVNRRRDFDYMVAFDRSFNLFRCHLCVDHLNFLADIVVGDAWLARTSHSKTGFSIVVCRKKETISVMADMECKGKIRRSEAGQADIIESQSRNFVYGDLSYAYADYLREIGEFCPEMRGPNLSYSRAPSRDAVERFHKENSVKIGFQREGKYRRLWWRKAVFEIGRDLYRYFRNRLSWHVGIAL
jgi:coenzyme F420 hydrogenase subunit beta